MGSGDPHGLQNRREAGSSCLRCVRLAHASANLLRSLAMLGISAGGSDAAFAPQLQNRREAGLPQVTVPSLRSGFRLRSLALLTPAKRLKFDSHTLPPLTSAI